MTATEALLERAIAGETLSPADIDAIHGVSDVLALGMAADEVRRRRHGATTTFARVQVVPLETVSDHLTLAPGAGEIRVSGALSDLDRAVSAIGLLAARAEGRVPVHGFSLAEVAAIAGTDMGRATGVLSALRTAGLECIADAPLDSPSIEPLIESALRAGLGIARATVDWAPAETRVALLDRAARILRSHREIVAFAPLPRRSGVHPSTGFEDVRLVALTRLLVDVPHVQVDWQLYGPKLAQVALTFGADDVDGVSPVDEAPEGKRRSPLEEIRRNILAASGEPVERDGRFAPRT